MDGINKKVVFIAVILSLITSFFIYVYINKVTKTTSSVEIVKVFIAGKTIPQRAMISASDVKEIQIDKKLILPGAFQNKAEIIGKRVKESIIEGEQILKDRLVDENKMSLSYTIPKAKRAVSINVNEASQVAGFLKSGDYVDIIATFEQEEVLEANRKVIYPKISKTILQNILVLGIGQENYTSDDENKKQLAKTVTLAVNINDVEKLVYSSEAGVIRLALRAVDDNENSKATGALRPEITGSKGIIVFPK